MANRIILLVSVLLAAVALAATSTSAAPAADECLAKPKGPAPAGKHWYFRTNRAIQRKCWYLGDEGETIVSVTPPKQSASAAPVETGQKPGIQWPSANARAELIDEPRVEQPAVLAPQPQREALPDAPDGATTRNWVVASRWPDSSIAFSSDPATMRNDPAPASQKIENPPAVLAAAAVEPAEQPSLAFDGSDDTSVALFAAALVLTVIVAGGAIFMSLASRRRDRRNSSSRHRVTRNGMHRDDVHRDEMPWTRVGEATATRPAPVARVPEQNSLSDEIEEMDRLLEIARQAARAN